MQPNSSRPAKILPRKSPLVWVRRGIWLYLWLLIFEGVLRKWVVPYQFNGAFAMIRDPLVILIYWFAYHSNKINSQGFASIAALGATMTVLAALQVTLAVTSLPVVLFGLHSYILHLPLIFVMRQTLTSEDLRKVGRFFLLLSAPMVILLIAQFRASPTSWLNAGAGEGSSQIRLALGHVRAAGTFSYGTGVSEFFPIVLAFLITEFLRNRRQIKWLTAVSTLATLLAIPVSGSRSLLLGSAIVAVAAVLIAVNNARVAFRLASFTIFLALVGVLSSQLAIFQESMTTFTARWEEAQGEQRTGDIMVDRLIAPGLNALREIQSTSLIGQGIGLGSNFAAALQNGSQGFLLSESEPVRVTEECGAVVGLLLMAYRLGLCLEMLYSSYKATRRTPLPFLLAAATSPVLLLNTMEQPTNLGFMVFGAGLAFAATAHARKKRPSQLVQRPQDSHQEWHNAVYVCNP